jgi:hypothetical protein
MSGTMAPRCSVCGAAAEYAAQSIDPRYPLGHCSVGHKGQPLVPVVDSPQRFWELAAAKRRESERRRHARHLSPGGKLSSRCQACADLRGARQAIHAGA